MKTGTVKFFHVKKGYGFIKPDSGGEDLFVHFKEIVMKGFKVLKDGQRVSYLPVHGPKGGQATQVKIGDQPIQDDDDGIMVGDADSGA